MLPRCSCSSPRALAGQTAHTVRRYAAVLDHGNRILGRKTFVEAITRPDIDDYKAVRSTESREQHKNRRITPRTINYEIAVLRTFFYFWLVWGICG
jgi:site-specific recombinase XerD